jgi:hypothetical protein
MKLGYLVLLVSLTGALPASAADRLTDRDVRDLVKRIEQGRDRFDDALDDRLKRSIVRGEAGEVHVARFLDDFQENIDRLEERLKPDYAASTEVATLLRQGTAMDRFFTQQPAGTRGISEWNRLASDLRTLAAAYGATFPIADNAPVRRIGDSELTEATEAIAEAAERVKRSLDSDLKKSPAISKSDREAIVAEAAEVVKDAKALRSRVKDEKPSSAEAERLMRRVARVRAYIDGHQVPAASAAWGPLVAPLQTVTAAYGSPVTAAR